MTTKLRVDDTLRSFIPPLGEVERDALERSLVETGRAIDPITVWRGTILDGHNRYAICTEYGLPYDTIEIDLPDRDAAKRWMFDHQVARRNLSRDQIIALAALRGVVLPRKLQLVAGAPIAAALATTEKGRAKLERVLAGGRSMRQVANDAAREGAPTHPPSKRRTRVEIAMDRVRTLNKRDLDAFTAAFLTFAESRDE